MRCSRCKHAFFLPNPSSTQTDAVHSIAGDAAADPSLVTPTATADLMAAKDPNESTWDGLGGEAVEAAAFDSQVAVAEPAPPTPTRMPAPAAIPEPELDEEDWQFSEEIRVEGDDLESELGSDFTEGLEGDLSQGMLDDDTVAIDATGTNTSSGTFGENEDFGEGYDTSALAADVSTGFAEATPAGAPDIAHTAADDVGESSGLDLGTTAVEEGVRDESNFGSVDDFSSLMEDDEVAVSIYVADSIANESASDLGISESVGSYSESVATDDLGDPESWDLVGSDDFAIDSPNLDAGLSGMGGSQAAQPVDAQEFFSEDAFDDIEGDIDVASSSLATGPVGQTLRVVGWAATVAAVSAVAFLSLQAEWKRWAEAPQSVSAGSIEASTFGATWVETSRAGAVLRFDGEVRNTSGQAIRPGGVQLVLLDANGVRLREPAIVAGIPLAEQILRESSAEVLLESAASASRRFSGQPLPAGEVRAFEALLLEEDLPSRAVRILLEVEEASPASTPVQTIRAPVANLQASESIAEPITETSQQDPAAGLPVI